MYVVKIDIRSINVNNTYYLWCLAYFYWFLIIYGCFQVQPSTSSAVSGNDLNPKLSSLSPILEKAQESKTGKDNDYT